ncbi:MAG TPA: hypothetical protein VGD56_21165 [Gemmatirosa sp.]
MRVPPARLTAVTLLALAAGARAAHAQAALAPVGLASTAPAPAAAASRTPAADPFMDDDDTPQRAALARRIAAGVSVAVSQPLGDFRRGGRVGFGVAGFASISADPVGILGLRLEGGAQNYGTTSLRTAQPGFGFSTTQLRQTTSNDIFWLGVGPQVTLPIGPIHPYGFATVGAANFSTTSSLQYALYGDPYGYNRQFQSTDLSNWALARAAGGGVRVRLGRAAGGAAYVDAGVRWQRVNDVSYLTPGAVPAGIDPTTLALRGRADFATYHLGVSVAGR